jgi:chorismate synthase
MCVAPSKRPRKRCAYEIEKTIHGKNTLGGVLEIVALNLPVGLGSFVQWDKRLEAKLAMAVMSVQAIKGVEVGDAFANARRLGTKPMTRSTFNSTFEGRNARIEREEPKAEFPMDSRSYPRRDETDRNHASSPTDS